jgi:hypothetical protein
MVELSDVTRIPRRQKILLADMADRGLKSEGTSGLGRVRSARCAHMLCNRAMGWEGS